MVAHPSKLESKRVDVNGAGDREIFKNFYDFNFTDNEAKIPSRKSSEVKVHVSKTSIVSAIRKPHFEKLKQKLQINNKNREIQRKLRAHKRRQDLHQLELRIDKLITVIDSRMSNEIKPAVVRSEKIVNRRVEAQIFCFIFVLIIYSFGVAYFAENIFTSEPQQSSFSLFSSQPPQNTGKFNFFSKFLHK